MRVLSILALLCGFAQAQSSTTVTFPVTQPSTVVVTIATSQPTTQPTPPTPQPPQPTKMALGINMPSNDPDNGPGMWNDVTRHSTGIYSIPNGFACWSYLFGYDSGNYALSWTGPQNGVTLVGKSFTPVSDNAGGWTASVPFNAGDRVEFRFLNPNNVTNLKLLVPGAKPGQMYTDKFLALMKPYKTIRMMPMERVNGTSIPATYRPTAASDWNVVWADRVKLTDFNWTANEVPVEALAELCKELGPDYIPWVCVPYMAPDDYIVGTVQIFKNYGVTKLKLEESNEFWNTGPQYQGKRIRDDAIKLGTYGSLDPNVAGARRAGELTAHMSQVAHAVMPGVQVVIAGQATWAAWLNDASSYMLPGSAQIGAVAPYFQPVDSSSNTVAGVLASCDTWIITILDPGLQDNFAVCQAKNLTFEAYEGGQSLLSQNGGALPGNAMLPDNAAQIAAFNSDPMTLAQFDPAMAVLTNKLFVTCQNRGMTQFCYFMVVSNWGRYGYWGLVQQAGEKPNPKTVAVNNWVGQ